MIIAKSFASSELLVKLEPAHHEMSWFFSISFNLFLFFFEFCQRKLIDGNFRYITIPLTPKAVSLLQVLKANTEHEWVFVGDDGERLSYEALRYQTQRLYKAADVPYRGEHVFRHMFATNCYYKGIDVKILSRLLGHADVNITYNIYVHLYGDGFDEMYSALVSEK